MRLPPEARSQVMVVPVRLTVHDRGPLEAALARLFPD